MVEPMSPELRDALLKEHEGLDVEILDRIMELLHHRFDLDPEENEELIAKLDAERRQLIEAYLPRWRIVSKRFQRPDLGPPR